MTKYDYDAMVRQAHAERAVALGEFIADIFIWIGKQFRRLVGRTA